MNCPCNPNKLYENCCQIPHDDIHKATTPEQLMRSRYSAFVLSNIKYLSKSHHSATRLSKFEYKELEKWTKLVKWVKLEVVEANNNTVKFNAFYIESGNLECIQEHSLFDMENDHWVYVKAL